MFEIIDNFNGKRTCAIRGDMDAFGVIESGLNVVLERMADDFAGDIALDFSDVEFMDSSGIGAIVYLHKRLAASGRTLELVGVSGQPRTLLSKLRIDRSIDVQSDVPVVEASEQQAVYPGV